MAMRNTWRNERPLIVASVIALAVVAAVAAWLARSPVGRSSNPVRADFAEGVPAPASAPLDGQRLTATVPMH